MKVRFVFSSIKTWSVILITMTALSHSLYSSKTTGSNKENKAREWIVESRSLGFQENKGQIDGLDGKPASYVLFYAQMPNLNIWITTAGITYQFYSSSECEVSKSHPSDIIVDKKKPRISWKRVDMSLKGASIKKENIISEKNITQGEVNYYFENCPNGVLNVKTYERIRINNIYAGIDWVLYSNDGILKYDFVVHPHADPKLICLVYEGGGLLTVEANQIQVKNEFGEITEGKLLCYQGNSSKSICSNYTIKKNKNHTFLGAGILPFSEIIKKDEVSIESNEEYSYEININTGNYNPNETLTIDPKLVWNTYLPAKSLTVKSSDCDSKGNVYVIGDNIRNLFPTLSWGSAYYQSGMAGIADIFIFRFTNTGVLIWSTYYGGNNFDICMAVKTDLNYNVYITGYTSSPNFPLKSSGVAYYNATLNGFYDLFIIKFDGSGVLNWATFYGGSSEDYGYGITADASGNVFVTGFTNSINFPLQSFGAAYYQSLNGGLDDAILIRFNNVGVLQWATYYGGSDNDYAKSITTDLSGNIVITGATSSVDFPQKIFVGAYNQVAYGGGVSDIIILRFSNTGLLDWATYYGGNSEESGCSIRTDFIGDIYVTGTSYGPNLPLQTLGTAYNQVGYGGGFADIFILKFTNTCVRQWATYFGGNKQDAHINLNFDVMELDGCGNLYITFSTLSTNLQTASAGCSSYFDGSFGTSGGVGADLFIAEFNVLGALVWASYWGAREADVFSSLAIDSKNNVFFVGNWTDFGGGGPPYVNPGAGAYFNTTPSGFILDGFIAKFIPIAPVANPSKINPSGCACNGSAGVVVSCGTPPYTYLWSTGSTASIINGLCAKSYSVVVTDASCQKDTAYFSLSGGGIMVTENSTNSTCGLNDGSASALPSGGIPAYSYLWSNGQTFSAISGLNPGTYIVTVTDSKGCTSTASASVMSPPILKAQFIKGTADCTGCTCKEWILVTATDGTVPYSYTWPDGYDKRYKNQLCPGSYTINIKDQNGCSVNVNLTAP